MAEFYTEGETTYTIEEGDRVTKVNVDRLQFKLSPEAHSQFEEIHDQWELAVCEKFPHDAFVGGNSIILNNILIYPGYSFYYSIQVYLNGLMG